MTRRSGKNQAAFGAMIAGIAATVMAFAPDAVAAQFVNRPLTLSRSTAALGLGLGIGHTPEPDPAGSATGMGLNLELQYGITSFLQFGLRTGVRFGTEGRVTQADRYGRTFETETYGTAHDDFANPEIALRWAVLHDAFELGLEGRLYMPMAEGSHAGIMLGVPVSLHFGRGRLDSGLFVPMIFDDETITVISIPLHLWFQVDEATYLGPLTGWRVHNPGGDRQVPFGFGVGHSAAYNLDVRGWLLFPDVSGDGSADTFGVGFGIELRI